MICDKNVINIIKGVDVNMCDKGRIIRNEGIKPQLFSQLIDYLRYEISKIRNIKFVDNKTEHEIENLNSIHTMNHLDYEDIKEIINELKNKFDELQFIKDIYLKMQNNNNVSQADILHVSISHSLFFGYRDDIKYKNYKQETISKDSHKNIINYIEQKTHNKQIILLNPPQEVSWVYVINKIVDIKVRKDIGDSIKDFIQLIAYVVFYYLKTNIECNKISIYNPMLGKENHIIIDVPIINEFISIIKNYNIC